ncbi:hypothetical protein MHU86_21278 [Fragilaria crotonensis]|nr:hypothetical protein MHU86_21278 [Fragilaria crotonensis]
MENQMEEHYFGDPTDSDSIGLADQLVRGLGIFAGLYNEEFLQNSVVGASVGRGGGENLLRSPTPTGLVLVMKPELHCLGGQENCCWRYQWIEIVNHVGIRID